MLLSTIFDFTNIFSFFDNSENFMTNRRRDGFIFPMVDFEVKNWIITLLNVGIKVNLYQQVLSRSIQIIIIQFGWKETVRMKKQDWKAIIWLFSKFWNGSSRNDGYDILLANRLGVTISRCLLKPKYLCDVSQVKCIFIS